MIVLNRFSLWCLLTVAAVMPALAPVHAEEELAEPEVSIIQDDKHQRVEEYRVGGRLYMVKIIPAKGPPYVMIDSDGDGLLEMQERGPNVNIQTPQWVLIQWN